MTEKEIIPGSRQFLVFTLPHKRDPQLKTPVIELDNSTIPATPIEYDSTEVIEKVVLDLGRSRERAAGYNAAAQEVLKTFGFTIQDYLQKRAELKHKNKAIEPVIE